MNTFRIIAAALVIALMPLQVHGQTGWSWLYPQPQGYSLRAVWGWSPEVVCGVGDCGAVVRWDRASDALIVLPTGLDNDFYAIWGAATDDFYVAGEGILLHGDGATWRTELTDFSLRGIYGIAADNIYAVGLNGTILHWDGASWTVEESGTAADLYGVWGREPDEFFAVGQGGLILHKEGGNWSPMTNPASDDLLDWLAVSGTQDGEVFVVGDSYERDQVIFWDGIQWQIAKGLFDYYNYSTIWSPEPHVAYVISEGGILVRWDDVDWTNFGYPCNGAFSALWSYDPQHLFAVGLHGAMLRSDNLGAGWEWLTDRTHVSLRSVRSSGGALYAAGGDYSSDAGFVLRWDGAAWTSLGQGELPDLSALWVWADDDIVAAGNAFYHWDGYVWTAMPVDFTNLGFNDIWGASPSDLWAVGVTFSGDNGLGVIEHWDGYRWSLVDVRDRIMGYHSVWGSAADDVYAGSGEGMMHWNGSTWQPMALPEAYPEVLDICGTSADNVYVLLYRHILHWDGTSWSYVPSPADDTDLDVNALLVSPANELFLLTDRDEVFYLEGGRWRLTRPALNRPDQSYYFPTFSDLTMTEDGHLIVYGRDWMMSWDRTPTEPQISLSMPTAFIHPGAPFWLEATFENPTAAKMSGIPLAIVFAGWGQYFLWPSWCSGDQPSVCDFIYQDLPPGSASVMAIPPFAWPDTGTEQGTDLYFYAAFLTENLDFLLSDVAAISWSYGP